MATAADVSATITEISGIADEILKELESVPAIAGAATVGDTILNLLSGLVSKALLAWSAANDTPITVESVTALLPNQTPLTPPNINPTGAPIPPASGNPQK